MNACINLYNISIIVSLLDRNKPELYFLSQIHLCLAGEVNQSGHLISMLSSAAMSAKVSFIHINIILVEANKNNIICDTMA